MNNNQHSAITQTIINKELEIIDAFQNANPEFVKSPPYTVDFQNRYLNAYYEFRARYINDKK